MSAYWFDSMIIIPLVGLALISLSNKQNRLPCFIALLDNIFIWILIVALRKIGLWNHIGEDYHLLYATTRIIPIFFLRYGNTKTSLLLLAVYTCQMLFAFSVWISIVIFGSEVLYNVWSGIISGIVLAQIVILLVGVGNGRSNGKLLHSLWPSLHHYRNNNHHSLSYSSESNFKEISR